MTGVVTARTLRQLRYARREVMWGVTQRKAGAKCGRTRYSPIVSLGVGGKGSGYTGVVRCSSVWACPVCSASIRQYRARQVEAAAVAHMNGGGSLLFVTLTLRHQAGDDLATALDLLIKGFHSANTSRAGRRAAEGLAVSGYVRATEITLGRNGWHPHLHVLLFLEKKPTAGQVSRFQGELFARWSDWFDRKGWARPTAARGVRAELVERVQDVAKYVAKVQDEHGMHRGVGMEMARGDLKRGRRHDAITPFELLDRLDDAGSNRARRAYASIAARWREYEAATAGRHAIRWSEGLLDRLGVADMLDAEIVASESNEFTRHVVLFDQWEWSTICRWRLQGRLLDLADAGRVDEINRLVAERLDQDRQSLAAHFSDPYGPAMVG